MDFTKVERILVIKLRHIGDVLLTLPVFRALQETFPHAQRAALVNAGTEGVLSGNPLIDELFSLDRGIKKLAPAKRYRSEIDFLRRIRKKGFDMTVDLTGGDRAALISFASGAKYRLGWSARKGFPGKKYLYTHLSGPDATRHMVLQNLDVVRQFGINTEDLSVDFHITGEDRASAGRILERHKVKDAGPIIHIHPTSRWLFKCWNDGRMAGIIKWLISEGATVIVTSSAEPHEAVKARSIVSLAGPSPRLVDLCAKTSLRQLAAIAEMSDLFFGVDSAPMHIAAAVNTPVVALFGPSGAFHWGPWDNESSKGDCPGFTTASPYPCRNGVQAFGRHTVIQRDWSCIPCGRDGCDGSKLSKCLEDIAQDEVAGILAKKLSGIKK